MTVVTRRVVSRDLVDRGDELSVLRSAWHEAIGGVPRAVLLTGEAGIGKTRLLDELVDGLSGTSALVLRGSCVPLAGRTVPYAPFRLAMSELCDAIGVEALRDLAGSGAAALGSLVHQLGDLTGDGQPTGSLLDVVARLLDRVSLDRPVLLVVEDLHWSDAATRDLLNYLVRALRNSHLLVVATLRTGPDPEPEVHDLVDELTRLGQVERVDLTRLSDHGITRQMHGILGSAPPAEMAARVVARSEGVPFLVEELTAAETGSELGVPASVRDLLLRQTRSLSPAAGEVLRAAAARGGPVDEATLQAVCSLGSALEPALRELVEAQLLVVERRGGTYRFRHALLREAVEEDLLPGEAAGLHERYAVLVESRSPTGAGLIEAAHHWWVAGIAERAYPAALSAAEAARELSAYGEELTLLERALALWDDVADPVTPEVPDRAALLVSAGRAARLGGRYRTALSLLDSARRRSAADDVDRIAEVLWEKSLLVRSLGAVPGIEEDLQSALLAGPGPGARARLLNGLLQVQLHERRTDASRATLRDALDAAEQAGDLSMVAHLTVTRAGLVGQDGTGQDEALGLYERAWEAGDATNDVPVMLRALDGRSRLLVELGRFDEAAAAARDGLGLAAARGSPVLILDYLVGDLADALLALGHWRDALALLESALQVDRPNLERGGLYTRLAAVRLATGDVEAAQAAWSEAGHRLAEAVTDPALLVGQAVVEAELAIAGGRPTAATDLARSAYEAIRGVVGPRVVWPLLHAAAVGSRAMTRTAGGAVPEWLVRAVDAARDDSTGSPYWPAVLDAELSATDITPWERAALAVTTAPVLVRLQTWTETARAQLAVGGRARAAELLAEVIRTAEELGARPVLDEARTLASRARLKGVDGSSEPAPPAEADGLTPRELEVLRLLADGRSNAAIARLLVISPKTVSVHVSHILDKLGVASRGEAAATAWARGLAGGDPVDGSI